MIADEVEGAQQCSASSASLLPPPDVTARAAAAFYHASRLDPTWADPVYARRIALFMAEPRMFSQYLRGSRRVVASPGVQRLDSLYLRALTLNPFPRRQQDAIALRYRNRGIPLDDLDQAAADGQLGRLVLPLVTAVRDLPQVTVDDPDVLRRLAHGQFLPAAGHDGPYAVLAGDLLVGVYADQGGQGRPEVVLVQPDDVGTPTGSA